MELPENPPVPQPMGSFPEQPPVQLPRPLGSHRWGLGTAITLTLLAGGITLLGGLIGGVIQQLAEDAGFPESAYGTLLGVMLVLTYVAIIVVVWVAARRSSVGLAEAVGLHHAPFKTTVGIGLGVALGARVVAGAYGVILETLGVELPTQELDPTQLLPQTPVGILLTLVLAVVLAPLAEEIVFRGVLLSSLRDRWGDAFAIGVSSAVFAAAHAVPLAMPPIFLLSLALGWAYVRARTLWAPIVAHALFNGIGVIALYALRDTGVL
jgi:membrane protease YdiL (CAAX protease family)